MEGNVCLLEINSIFNSELSELVRLGFGGECVHTTDFGTQNCQRGLAVSGSIRYTRECDLCCDMIYCYAQHMTSGELDKKDIRKSNVQVISFCV